MPRKNRSKGANIVPESGEVAVRFLKSQSDGKQLIQSLINPTTNSVNKGLEEPPLDPKKLAAIFEISSCLRPNIDAYITNIYSRGYRFEPAIDLNAPDTLSRVKDAMYIESLLHAYDVDEDISKVTEPSDDEVNSKIDVLRRQAILELAVARRFFSGCYPDGSFVDLLKLTGQNQESIGNGFWEILRGKKDRPRNLKYIPSVTMRVGKGTDDDVPVRVRQKITDISYETVQVRRTFKKFAQVDDSGQPVTWFKEFGDPRIMSKKTGNYYDDLESLIETERKSLRGIKKSDKKAVEAEIVATEVFHFSIPSLISLSGIPRWAGNTPAVLGSRELDETNLDYFLSNAIPALALLCSGGRLGTKVDERLKEFFTEEVRGKHSTHKLLVLEAETQRHAAVGPTQRPRLEFVPLRAAQQQDALFQIYDQRNIDKVGRSFRLPASLMGVGKFEVSDLRYAEEQVYQPERESLDSKINKFLLPELGVYFWEFKSNAAMARDPEVIGDLALRAVKEGAIVPAECRKILEKVFNTDLPTIRALWVTQPLPLTLAALGIAAGPAEAVREQGRQDGTESPQSQLLRELGLGPEEGAVIDTSGGGNGKDGNPDLKTTAENYNILERIQSLRALSAERSNSIEDEDE